MPLPRAKEGEAISADAWNQLVDFIEDALGITVDASSGLEMREVGGKKSFRLNLRDLIRPAVTTSTITAASGTGNHTVGTGTGTLLTFNGSTTTAANGRTITIKNRYTASVATSTLVWVVFWRSQWFVLGADCPP